MQGINNKRILQAAFAALEQGNGKPFLDCMSDDITWTVMGTTPWSGAYVGKEAVHRDLLAPLFAQFADRYTNRAVRFIAEDNYVVVECRGQSYNNSYCYVCQFLDGRMIELTEYLDTAPVERLLTAPV